MARILLDECVDARLRRHLPGHEVTTVPRRGWASTPDRNLVPRARLEFDVLITVDKLLPRQEAIEPPLSVIVVSSPTQGIAGLLPLVPRILSAIDAISPGDIVTITAD